MSLFQRYLNSELYHLRNVIDNADNMTVILVAPAVG